MEIHLRAFAWLSIIFGAIGAVCAIGLLIYAGGFVGLFYLLDNEFVSVLAVGVVCVQLLTAVPAIVGGWGLLRFRPWARVLMMAVSGLNTLNFPVGSVLGGYGLWLLTTPEIEPLFAHELVRYRKATPRPGTPSQRSNVAPRGAGPLLNLKVKQQDISRGTGD